jgi:hypothetical protein
MSARFRDVVAAEWIKLWSLRSTWWSLAFGSLAIIAMNVNAALTDYANWPSYPAAFRDVYFDPRHDAFTNNAHAIVMLAAGSVGAITVVGEYGTGLIRTTFAAVPARGSVVAAKVAVVTAVFTAAGAVAAGVSFWATQVILAGRHAGMSIADQGALRAVVASALLAPLSAVVGMGIGALIRHTATTIVTTTFVLLMLPLFFDRAKYRWIAEIRNAQPDAAWVRLMNRISVYPAHYHPPTITRSWLVYAAWPLVAVAVAAVVMHRRDV